MASAARTASTSAAAEGDGVAASLGEEPGRRIGPYKILQVIGEGGFGSVYMAEQERPVARRVALKIIKLGMDTRQVVARFEQERQALAMMDHPNIAKVFDAGATETGRPYFAMELVRGDPITEYCDRNNLGTVDRLKLFTQVCRAVQHAHQKGIIHRDIKPSNVLVTVADGTPIPKVIDFGIAKATSAKLTDKTLVTEYRQLIGTPQYMSPEQAEMSGVDVDTRSDVYSLGVLLYALLTGTTPFDSTRLGSASFAEIQKIVREVEPPRPSTRLGTMGDALASVAARRRTDPARLRRSIRGDLDWIVMKAVEKDRTRRYETANGLAADVERHLAGEAVIAAPPSTVYRMRKFVRRNRIPVAAGLVVAAALVLGLVGTLWQAARANASAQAERERADQLKQVSDFQAGMLEQVDAATAGEHLGADIRRRFDDALAAAGVPEPERRARASAFDAELARVNATDAAIALIDDVILRPAVSAIDEQFEDQPFVDAQLRQVLADRYRDLGLYDSAESLQARALAARRRGLGNDHPDTLESVNGMGALLYDQGRFAEAEAYWREALETRRRVLGEDNPDTLISMSCMASVIEAQGRVAEAETYHREVLEKRRRVVGEDHPDTLISIGNVGNLLFSQGRYSEAEPYFREALAKRRRVSGEEHLATLVAVSAMGSLLKTQGKLDEAEPLYREALEKRRRLLGEDHPTTLISVSNMGFLLYAQGRLDEAEPLYREVLEKRRRLLGDEHPKTLISIIRLGTLLQAEGRTAEVVELLAPAEPAARRVFTGGNAVNLGVLLYNLGRARTRSADDAARAEANLIEAHAILLEFLGEEHKETRRCVEGLIDLYEAWDRAEPGSGHDAKAAEWKAGK